MHTVEMLEQMLVVCRRAGYSIRQEWLGGAGGGLCEIKGQKWVFVDLALPPDEQLEQLRQDLDAIGEKQSGMESPVENPTGLRRSA